MDRYDLNVNVNASDRQSIGIVLHLPPIECATFQPGTGVKVAGMKRHDLICLKLREKLGRMFEFAGDEIQRLVHPCGNFS